MLDSNITALLGGTALASTMAAVSLNGIFAFSLGGSLTTPDALRFLLFIGFGLTIVTIVYLAFFAYVSFRKINNHAVGWSSRFRWRMLAMGVVLSTISVIVTGIPLIWLATRLESLPKKIAMQSSMVIFIIWFAVWGVSMFAQIAMYAFIGQWTNAMLRANSVGHLDLDFGIHTPPTDEVRSAPNFTRESFNSQDPTLHSPPRTPTTPISSSRRSSSTRVGTGSSRVKLVQKGSANSSLDFLDWDTSSVHHEIRATLHSSSTPPVTRSGLETIPGSRPESPADALEGPFLPDSPHAISSDAATAIEFFPSSPPSRLMSSSPPSSPPNFSRPTSRDQSTTLDSMLEIHPLFRPNSPKPAPIAISNLTRITASPMADHAITPRTLARIRSDKVIENWRGTPSQSSSPPISPPSSPGQDDFPTSFGSPGPSIAEEQDLPPILPGFVLGAGQRSSLHFYSQRKSMKERPQSSYSQTSRRSSLR